MLRIGEFAAARSKPRMKIDRTAVRFGLPRRHAWAATHSCLIEPNGNPETGAA